MEHRQTFNGGRRRQEHSPAVHHPQTLRLGHRQDRLAEDQLDVHSVGRSDPNLFDPFHPGMESKSLGQSGRQASSRTFRRSGRRARY